MTCIVKVIQNSGQPSKYTIEHEDQRNIKITIRIQTFPADLDKISAQLRTMYCFKQRYEVLFNFKAVGDQIRNYVPFREAMIRMLYKKDPDLDIMAMVELVQYHMKKGKYPDFSKTDDPKTFQKISNYISNVCGQTLPATTVADVCKKLTELYH
jgi:hypothetical protein